MDNQNNVGQPGGQGPPGPPGPVPTQLPGDQKSPPVPQPSPVPQPPTPEQLAQVIQTLEQRVQQLGVEAEARRLKDAQKLREAGYVTHAQI